MAKYYVQSSPVQIDGKVYTNNGKPFDLDDEETADLLTQLGQIAPADVWEKQAADAEAAMADLKAKQETIDQGADETTDTDAGATAPVDTGV